MRIALKTEKCLKPNAYSIKTEKNLNTHGYSIETGKGETPSEEDFSPFEPPALRRHAYTRPRSFARTHARTTRTRNETETDFPIGFS